MPPAGQGGDALREAEPRCCRSSASFGTGPGFGCWATPALCSWELIGRREDFAAWLCWHGCDVRTGLRTRRNVCFKASFLTLIKTTKARLASFPAEPKNCNLVPKGEKPSKTWQRTGVKCCPEEWVALAEPEGTAAGWHRAGTGPAALPRPSRALQGCPRAAPLSPQRRATGRLIFGLERRATPARSAMFPLRCDLAGKCQVGAWGAAEAAGASSRSRLPGCLSLPCRNTLLIHGSGAVLTLPM